MLLLGYLFERDSQKLLSYIFYLPGGCPIKMMQFIVQQLVHYIVHQLMHYKFIAHQLMHYKLVHYNASYITLVGAL